MTLWLAHEQNTMDISDPDSTRWRRQYHSVCFPRCRGADVDAYVACWRCVRSSVPPLADDETMKNVICVVELDRDRPPRYPYCRYMRIKALGLVRSALHFWVWVWVQARACVQVVAGHFSSLIGWLVGGCFSPPVWHTALCVKRVSRFMHRVSCINTATF